MQELVQSYVRNVCVRRAQKRRLRRVGVRVVGLCVKRKTPVRIEAERRQDWAEVENRRKIKSGNGIQVEKGEAGAMLFEESDDVGENMTLSDEIE